MANQPNESTTDVIIEFSQTRQEMLDSILQHAIETGAILEEKEPKMKTYSPKPLGGDNAKKAVTKDLLPKPAFPKPKVHAEGPLYTKFEKWLSNEVKDRGWAHALKHNLSPQEALNDEFLAYLAKVIWEGGKNGKVEFKFKPMPDPKLACYEEVVRDISLKLKEWGIPTSEYVAYRKDFEEYTLIGFYASMDEAGINHAIKKKIAEMTTVKSDEAPSKDAKSAKKK